MRFIFAGGIAAEIPDPPAGRNCSVEPGFLDSAAAAAAAKSKKLALILHAIILQNTLFLSP